MKYKGTKQNHEDVKYSFIVIRKCKRPMTTAPNAGELENHEADFATESFNWPRLVGAPMKRDKHVVLDLCNPSGNQFCIPSQKKQY